MPDETPVMPLHDALDAGDDEPGARKQAINRGKLCINAASPAPRIDADLLAHGVALLHGERYRYESAVRFHAAMNPTGARQTRNVLGGTSENDENNRRGLAAFDAVLAEVEAAGRMRAAIATLAPLFRVWCDTPDDPETFDSDNVAEDMARAIAALLASAAATTTAEPTDG